VRRCVSDGEQTDGPTTTLHSNYPSSPVPNSAPATGVSTPYRSGDSFKPITPITPITPIPNILASSSRTSLSSSRSSGTDLNRDYSTDCVSSASTSSSYFAPQSPDAHIQPPGGSVFRGDYSPMGMSFMTCSPTDAPNQSVYSFRSSTSSIYPPSPQNMLTHLQPVSPIICTSFDSNPRNVNFDSTAGRTPPYRPEVSDGLSTVRSYRSLDDTVASLVRPDSPTCFSPIGTGFSGFPSKTVYPSYTSPHSAYSTTDSF
jgi:hypothetical protein